MSTTFLKIIPTDSGYVPEKNLQDKAQVFLSKLFDPNKIDVLSLDSVEFIDQGQNFESVRCNYCGKDIDIADWQNAMDNSYENQFQNLTFKTHCCNTETSLNEVIYQWPAGFAKFVITIEDPLMEPDADIVDNLKTILHSDLKLIWAHY